MMNENRCLALHMQQERRQRLKRQRERQEKAHRMARLLGEIGVAVVVVILGLLFMAAVGAADRATEAQAATIIYSRQEALPVWELPQEAIEAEAEVTPVQPAEEILFAEPVSDPEINRDDVYLLAHLICGEAQGYSRECQEAVGSVVLNRVADARYPDTIREVVYQKGQYACITDGNFDREPTALNWQIAEDLLKSGSKIPATVVYQAQFRQGRGVWKKIGSEIFCY